MSGNNDGWSFNRFDEYDARLIKEQAQEDETLQEGMHREADTGKVVDKAEIGKTYYPNMPKQKSSVALRKEKEGKLKEALEAAGIFTAEEIESLVEANCGSKGYQEGGEVKADCDKCKGEGCDHCKKEKKSEKKDDSKKPDYIDADDDGNKEEPMTKALKEKGDKKEVKEDVDPIVEAAVAALGALLGKAGAAAKAAGSAAAKGAAKAASSSAAKSAGSAVKDAAIDTAVDTVKSIPGKVADAAKGAGDIARSTQNSDTSD